MIDLPAQPPKPDEAQAEFNSALAYLERLNKTEYLIEFNLMTWNLRDCYVALESYENELAFIFKPGEQEEVDRIKGEINTYFNKYPMMGAVRGRVILHANITPLVRQKLIELNKYLRKIKYKAGMGMPKKGESKLF